MMMMMMMMMIMIVSCLTTKLIDFNFFIIKVTLTEMLIDAELSEYPDVPVNPYRKLLGIKIISHLDNYAVVENVLPFGYTLLLLYN